MTLEILRRGACDGHRPPLLFVHGAWHAAWCWDEHFLPRFAEQGHLAVAPSLPGHGGSPAPRPLWRLSIDDYVEAVVQVARELPASPVLIGHSMGGFVVQHAIHRVPARGAVLLASVPPSGVLRTTLRIAARHPLRFAWANLRLSLYPLVSTPALVRELFYSPEVPEAKIARHAAALGDESYRAFWDMLALRLPRRRPDAVPMRVLGGTRDAIFRPAEVEATAAFHGVPARLFDGAHNLMLEPCWRQVADEIAGWIASLPAAREAAA